METQQSVQFLRKRKFLVVLPLLVLPFLTLGFWSLGGGKGISKDDTLVKTTSGLNLTLPEASFKDEKPMDKLKFYELADRDSNRMQKLIKQDPYYATTYVKNDEHSTQLGKEAPTSVFTPSFSERSIPRSPAAAVSPKYADPNEEKVMKKLEALTKAMEEQEISSHREYEPPITDYEDSQSERLMAMINQLSNTTPEKDPELTQLDLMLDKILDIQHPERLNKGTIKETTEEEKVYVVQHVLEDHFSLIEPEFPRGDENMGEDYGVSNIQFWGLEDTDIIMPTEVNAGVSIPAVIHESQTIVTGATIKLRLLEKAHIAGTVLSEGQFVYGTASLNNERLQVEIKSIRAGNNILPVKWKVFDMDGMEGVYIPGSIERDISKQSGGNAIQSIDLMNTINPSLEMQAASLGIQTAKSLLSKKVKLVKVNLKAGYQVLIKDMNTVK